VKEENCTEQGTQNIATFTALWYSIVCFCGLQDPHRIYHCVLGCVTFVNERGPSFWNKKMYVYVPQNTRKRSSYHRTFKYHYWL